MLITSSLPIVLNFDYKKPINKVWEALTVPAKMKNWFFEQMKDFNPQVGFKTAFPVFSGERTFTHLWKVLAVEPNKKITTQWTYTEYKGEGHVTFLLDEIDKKTTRLTLINEVIADFPTDMPEFTRDSCTAGWNYFLGERLTAYFKGLL